MGACAITMGASSTANTTASLQTRVGDADTGCKRKGCRGSKHSISKLDGGRAKPKDRQVQHFADHLVKDAILVSPAQHTLEIKDREGKRQRTSEDRSFAIRVRVLARTRGSSAVFGGSHRDAKVSKRHKDGNDLVRSN
jgi:hypothetical protein